MKQRIQEIHKFFSTDWSGMNIREPRNYSDSFQKCKSDVSTYEIEQDEAQGSEQD